MARRTLKHVSADIRANVWAQISGTIDWATFDRQAMALWREVDKGEPRIIGSPCDRRYSKVQQYLDEEQV